MHKIGDCITNMGGGMNYINCDCITEVNEATEVNLTLDTGTGKYYLEGISTQTGTPTPDNPIEIVNTYKAGHYKTTINGTTYKFSLADDLRSLGTVKDKLELDINNITAKITRKIYDYIFNGNEIWNFSSLSNLNRCYTTQTRNVVKANSSCVCTHYIEKLSPSGYPDIGGCNINANGVLTCNSNDFDNVNEFKMWLSNNNMEINCELSTQATENVEVY